MSEGPKAFCKSKIGGKKVSICIHIFYIEVVLLEIEHTHYGIMELRSNQSTRWTRRFLDLNTYMIIEALARALDIDISRWSAIFVILDIWDESNQLVNRYWEWIGGVQGIGKLCDWHAANRVLKYCNLRIQSGNIESSLDSYWNKSI